jgi:hypothetical protein
MGVLIAFLALGAGLLGSLFPDEIKVAFPFVLWPSHPWIFAPYAFLFWFCVLGWLSLYLVRLIVEGEYLEALKTQAAQLGTNVKALGGTTGEIHQNVKNASESAVKLQDAINAAQRQIDELNHAVQTLPPPKYLSQLNTYTGTFNKTLRASLPRQCDGKIRRCSGGEGKVGPVTKSDLEALIRSLLSAVATLAREYDPNPRYAANVMYFVPSSDKSWKSLNDYKKFMPNECENSSVVGALVLDLSLTASSQITGEEGNKPDEHMSPICFPILEPYIAPTTGKFRVLPGAPLAFAEARQKDHGRQKPIYVLEDLQKIRPRLEKGYDFPESVIHSLEIEHKESEWVRSGLSFPLFETCQEKGHKPEEQPIGVLNLYCNQEHFLGPIDERRRLFAMTTLHLVNDIAETTRLWLRL